MKLKNLIKVTLMVSICNVSFGQGLEMGGPPPKKKEKKRSDVSPNKQEFLPVQKKYQDQIVFSNSKISKTEADPNSFVSTWDMTQPLFYRVFRTNTIAEGVYDYMKKTGKEFNEYYYADFATLVVVSINGKEMATRESKFSGVKMQVNEWVTSSGFISNPALPKKSSGDIGSAIKRAFHAMGDEYKEGTVDVKIEVYAVDSELDRIRDERPKSDRVSLLTTGNLKIKITKEGMKNFAPTMCFGILKNGTSMIDPDLEEKIMVKFSQTYGKAVSANIQDEDWRIIKNSLGVPLKRNMYANVAYYDKSDKLNIIEYYFHQTYDGSGYQKSLRTTNLATGASESYSPYCILYKKELVK